MSTKVKCIVQKYDPKVTKAPFTFINLAECWIEDTDDGLVLYDRMWDAVWAAGFEFKFYSLCSDMPGYKYSITVRS